jgi:aryl-alcohol dehydrogenase-like predicted oxidoreductase
LKESKNNISKLILGTVQLGLHYGINNQSGMPSKDRAFDILNSAKQNGIGTLDTAQAYGDAIDIIGEFHKSNEPFNIITKISYSKFFELEEYVTSLLTKLNITKLEGVLFHKFSDIFQYDELLVELSKLKQNGLIDKVGASIYTNEELKACADIAEIDLIQLPFNLLDNYSLRGSGIQEAILNKKNIHVRSVFLQGLFFMSIENLPLILKPLVPYLIRLRQIAKENNMELNELAIKYVLQTSQIEGVLIGVDSVEQLEKNISLSNSESLNQVVIDQINSIHVSSIELLNPVNWK